MPPLKGEEACEHVERVSAIAWSNGAYKATEALKAENARLKTEAERYRLASLRVDVGELHAQFNRALFDETVAENARLKAEVERLTIERNGFEQAMNGNIALLKMKREHIERLTEAGDAMAEEMLKLNHPHASIYLWCRAKDGKGCKAEEGKPRA